MWTDPYKQIPYIGISISFVDGNWIYKSLDLCCQPYVQKDHTGENILVARTTFHFLLLLLSSLYSLENGVLQNGT